ncbi:MAG TPA: SDR family NAD(P)-dependent oxidoreductase [Geminicoccus sp.]|jgi:NADP-dependent 3-hydroxy acid dehydrogenase YdfG|uniref:SDR family oxidoreductase n=1 Tax=Geminicoccus sp. TaxID=2024832 RepID=UPI002E34C352|nr:SDR family NAD(P)-dependent oxidoreductase [Geminicoccus sp.]HEX2527963.1 SDR family NAD(P)-dependent oxidoreductase [Geminicoccus sp.]
MAPPLVMITGASSGIGRALALAFAREGHPLLLLARHMEPIAELRDHPATYAVADVADPDAVAAAMADGAGRHGPVECLVYNAGTADARAFGDVDPASYAREIDTNLKGVLNCTKAVLAGMQARRSGTVINMSSISDRKTSPAAVTYTATKHAVRALTESLRESEQRHGIRFINIAPGYIRTNIHAAMGISFDEYCRMLGNPDFMSPEQLADIVLYCWKLPQGICIRDLVVAPTRTSF